MGVRSSAETPLTPRFVAAILPAVNRVFVVGVVILLPAITYGQAVSTQRALINQYCISCHNDKLKSGGLSWTQIDLAHPEQNREKLEQAIRKLRAGMMPPVGAPRPDARTMKAL